MLKIYGFDASTWTNAVRFTANLLDLEHEFVRVNLPAGDGREPDPGGRIRAQDPGRGELVVLVSRP